MITTNINDQCYQNSFQHTFGFFVPQSNYKLTLQLYWTMVWTNFASFPYGLYFVVANFFIVLTQPSIDDVVEVVFDTFVHYGTAQSKVLKNDNVF